jgi:hypoxanthine phosphoribosyltransferase
MGLRHRRIGAAEQRRLAHALAGELAPFEPEAVVYVRSGGELAGRSIARALGVRSSGLDIRYPATRLIERLPRTLRPVLFAVKELLYRATRPAAVDPAGEPLPRPGSRTVLVDDSASSGKTLRTALEVLSRWGIERRQVRVAVLRCGRRARTVVDHFAITEPVTFVHESTRD